jgi:hypothetical protein
MCEKSFSRQILTQALIPLTIWKPLDAELIYPRIKARTGLRP